MDALRRDDILRARLTPPEEKLKQALDLMRIGISLQRSKLRLRHPDAEEAEIRAMLVSWLGRVGA